MRVGMLLLAMAGLCACDRNVENSDKPAAPVVSAAISFDGADYSTPAQKLKHGERMARVLACKGCHGETLQGENVTADDPQFGDMNAPNISLLLASYSDAELERVIRHGVPRDGRTFWFMASEAFQFLSDRDLAALIAYLRTVKPGGKPMPPIRKGPGFEQALKTGEIAPAPEIVARFRKEPPPDLGPQHEFGRGLARIVCGECHNSQLQGYEGFSPNLDIAGTYSAAELETLLTTGKGKSKPDLGLMSETARNRLKDLTPHERQAIIAYVKARADRPQPAQAR